MKNIEPMYVSVPDSWKFFARCCVIFSIFILLVQLALCIFPKEPIPSENISMSFLGLAAIGFLQLYMMPCWINRYPSWVVFLLGRNNLELFISKCHLYFGFDGEVNFSQNFRNIYLFILALTLIFIGGFFANLLFYSS